CPIAHGASGPRGAGEVDIERARPGVGRAAEATGTSVIAGVARRAGLVPEEPAVALELRRARPSGTGRGQGVEVLGEVRLRRQSGSSPAEAQTGYHRNTHDCHDSALITGNPTPGH